MRTKSALTACTNALTACTNEVGEFPLDAVCRDGITKASYHKKMATLVKGTKRTTLKHVEPRLTRFYIGLGKGDQARNSAVRRPSKNMVIITICVPQSAEMQWRLECCGLGIVDLNRRDAVYRARVGTGDFQQKGVGLRKLLRGGVEPSPTLLEGLATI